jgi:hypothetical protein
MSSPGDGHWRRAAAANQVEDEERGWEEPGADGQGASVAVATAADARGEPVTGLASVAQSEGEKFGLLLLRVGIIVVAVTIQVTAILLVIPKETLEQYQVNKETCGGCDCWDRLSKAPYDPGRYKTMYWNMEPELALIFGMISLYIVMFEKLIESLATSIWRGRASWWAVLAVVATLPGNFYSVGAMYHYINDRFHIMVPTQLYFMLTEFLTLVAAWRCVDTAPPSEEERRHAKLSKVLLPAAPRDVTPYLWVAWVNALCHFIIAGLDQAFLDIFVRSDSITPHALARGAIFSSTDLLVLIWATVQLNLFGLCRTGPSPPLKHVLVALGATVAIVFAYRNFLPLV